MGFSKSKRGNLKFLLVIALSLLTATAISTAVFAATLVWAPSSPWHEPLYANTIVSKNNSLVTVANSLAVVGNIELNLTGELFISLNNFEANGREWALISAGSLGGIGIGKFSIYDKTADASRLTIDANGNVGIGTLNPTQKLDVNGIVNAVDFYQNGTPLNLGWISNGNNIYNTNTGNVGIGTTNPQAKLDVNGGVKLGNDAAACIAEKTGTLRWDGNSIQLCKLATVTTYTDIPGPCNAGCPGGAQRFTASHAGVLATSICAGTLQLLMNTNG